MEIDSIYNMDCLVGMKEIPDMYQPPLNEPCDTTKCKECVLLYMCKTKSPKIISIDLI